MRIAMIGQKGIPANYGGVEKAVEEVSALLVERGHEVTVFNVADSDAPQPRFHRGIRLRYVKTPDSKHLGQLVQSAKAASLSALAGYDIVHFHALGPCLFTPIPRLRPGTRVVATVQGRDDQRAKWNRPARVALGTAARMSATVPHQVITVSGQLQAEYEQEFDRETVHIPNGVTPIGPAPAYGPDDNPEHFGLEPGKYLINVGRLVPEKAVDKLIRAFRSVPGDTKLAIVGGSSHTDGYVDTLEQLAAADPRVVLTGPVYGHGLDALYRHAMGYVMPSDLEGLPLSLLEGISYGLPVVVSDIGPHLEVVKDSAPGRRVFPAGNLELMSKQLAALVTNPAEEQRAAQELMDRVMVDFSWDRITTLTEQVYENALSGSATATQDVVDLRDRAQLSKGSQERSPSVLK